MTQSNLQAAELKQLNALLREKIDQLQQTEVALRESEKRYALAVQGSRDGLWDWNVITDEVYYSPQFKAILGYQDSAIASEFSEFALRLHPEDRHRTLAALQQHLTEKTPYDVEYRLQTKQGNYCWIYARGQAVWNESEQPTRMAGSITDITGRKQTEGQLKDSLKELADVKFALDRSSFLAITDARGQINEVNDQFCKISEYGRSELIGKNHRLINSGHHPTEFFQEMWQTITHGNVWQGEIKNQAKNGSFYWVDTTIVPIVGESGVLLQFVAIRNDITERKQAEAELRQLNDKLEGQVQARTQELEQRAQELERSNAELEQFAYVASHDLQEPLRTVSSFTELLAQEYGDRLDGEAEEYIEFIVDGALRMQQLVKDLLLYSRLNSRGKAFAPTACESVLKRALGNFQLAIAQSKGQITHDPLPDVYADESQVQQLFQNLISNALKFRAEAPPHVHISATASAEPSGDWTFCVSDNGIGIEPEYREQIFEIFRRLHSRRIYAGTGIGLAICRKIVQRHGGQIWVEDSPEKGAAFYFTLPSKPELAKTEHAN
ncbi:MAG: PAS domain-containing protein [Phormidesmis sp.]